MHPRRERGTISVQVLNEFAAVALRNLRMPLSDVREILDTVRAVCSVEPVTLATHERGLAINERYGFALYDSMIVASALIAGGKALYAEDLQDGQVIDAQLRVVNPFLTGWERRHREVTAPQRHSAIRVRRQ